MGLILPKELLARLGVKTGQTVFVAKTYAGYSLTTVNPTLGQQIDAGLKMMDQHNEVFVELAKREAEQRLSSK